ncbi:MULTISPECIES: hypothetical protein [unclassified Streptomyces]|uniref:hypothetical protein n=1 Tax=unclassified Streptomyces TaxID=2593676 RepID=UPI002E0E1961|nr:MULTISPECIES: hypothetical protein [unclassified Streptomyces]WSR23951.1 hypothetical protein OG573_36080 [Streptomyces sp. NBC_01205]
MSTWLILMEETVTTDGSATTRQVTTVRPLSGNRTREEALVELFKAARSHVPDSLRSTARMAWRDADGSFWILPRNANGKVHASCNIRLVEQIRP